MSEQKIELGTLEIPYRADIAITIEDTFGWAVIGDNGYIKTHTCSLIKLYEKNGFVSALHRVEYELERMLEQAEVLGTVCLRMPSRLKNLKDGLRRERGELVMQMMQRFFGRHDVAFIAMGCSRVPNHISSKALEMTEALMFPPYITLEHKNAQRNALETLLYLDYMVAKIQTPENDNHTKDPSKSIWCFSEGDAA